jgi:hypothetical protein
MGPNVAGTEAKLRDGITPSLGPHPLPLHSALSGCIRWPITSSASGFRK